MGAAMNLKSLRPAYEFAQKFGAKMICYGPPGSGKTPLVNTAPRPVLFFSEPGMLSMRTSQVPAFPVFTVKEIEDAFAWVFGSNEANNFDTIAFDSLSQMAEIYLAEAEKSNKHGLKAYGDMSEGVMKHLNNLYYLKNKHTYLICKQQALATDTGQKFAPYFPGKELNTKVPHLYDIIAHCAVANVPGVGPVKALRTRESFDILARDRSGMLSEFEQPDLGKLFAKAMQ
jgi:hypothetical protein